MTEEIDYFELDRSDLEYPLTGRYRVHPDAPLRVVAEVAVGEQRRWVSLTGTSLRSEEDVVGWPELVKLQPLPMTLDDAALNTVHRSLFLQRDASALWVIDLGVFKAEGTVWPGIKLVEVDGAAISNNIYVEGGEIGPIISRYSDRVEIDWSGRAHTGLVEISWMRGS